MSSVIKADTSQLSALVADLRNAADVIGTGAARATNTVAKDVRKTSVQRVVSHVNMTESYVDPKITISQEATSAKPMAVISAPMRGALLPAFGAQQQSAANFWTAAKFAEVFGSLQAQRRPNKKAGLLPWTPRTGDPLRGIAPGAKQAGARVAIRAGQAAEVWSHVFFIPIQGGKWASMSRPKGGGKAQAKYGPSVDQVVKIVWQDDEQQISETLGTAVLASVTEEINRELKL